MQHHIRTWLPFVMAGVMVVAGASSVSAADPGGNPPAAPQGAGKTVTTDLYTVQDGNKVDPKTLNGWKTWRALACERCHGADQEGGAFPGAPALVQSLKTLSKEDFHTTIMKGRLPPLGKGMPNFDGSKMVVDNWEGLYAYLKGRSDGNILPGHLYAIGSTTGQNHP